MELSLQERTVGIRTRMELLLSHIKIMIPPSKALIPQISSSNRTIQVLERISQEHCKTKKQTKS